MAASGPGIARLVRNLVVTIGVLLLLTVILPVEAADFAVDTTADTLDANPGDGVCADSGGACSLRAAIGEANALPGADTINLPAGSYLLTRGGANEDVNASGDLDITQDLLLNGAGRALTTIDGNQLDRVFHIHSEATVRLQHLTVSNGKAPDGGTGAAGGAGGGVLNTGRLTLFDTLLTANRAGHGGHGVDAAMDFIFGLYTCATAGEVGGAGGSGGAVYSSGALTVTHSTLIGNLGGDGGGGGHDCIDLSFGLSTSGGPGGDGGHGGAVYSAPTGQLLIQNSTLTGNHTGTGGDHGGTREEAGLGGDGGDGGAVHAGDLVVLANSTVSGNVTGNGGRGFNTIEGDGTGGSGGDGGGILAGGTMTISHLTVTGNRTGVGGAGETAGSDGSGGGIASPAGGVQLQATILAANTATNGPDCSGTLSSQNYNLVGSDANCTFASQPGDLVGSAGSEIDPLLGALSGTAAPAARMRCWRPVRPSIWCPTRYVRPGWPAGSTSGERRETVIMALPRVTVVISVPLSYTRSSWLATAADRP